MKRVLITGGCGFVGRHFAKRLLNDGWSVMLVDDLSAGIHPNKWILNLKLSFSIQDFRQFIHDSTWQYLEQFDLVIHCAAIVGGRLKIEGDPLAVATDLAIDSDLFQWAIKTKPKKIIYFSSSAVYPIEFQQRKVQCKLAEQMVHFNGNKIGVPDLTYGWAKLTGEYLAKQAVDRYGINVVIYRPFSGYGEDQSFDYPFPSIIRRVVGGEDPIAIWGNGDQCRDFIHIDDIVECVLQTMNELEPGEVLNLGSGIPTAFDDLARLAHATITNIADAPKIVTDTSKPEGVFWRVADTHKMNQFYKPKISLEEGIRRVAAHLTAKGK